jgi:hypothetical protein
VTGAPARRYTSPDEDSGRWTGFPFRDGDIVVSTRSKHGTTWVQTILLLLIHQRPDLPGSLSELSPWLDHLVEDRDAVIARLHAQEHRRVVKTHTPLDGVVLDERATYVVVARHPLDAAVSLYHQGNNLDRERLAALTGAPVPESSESPTLGSWLEEWVEADPDPVQELDSLPGVFWHLRDAWSRRHDPNVVLLHYADLLADLEGHMRRLAQRLSIGVDAPLWPALVEAASLQSMRARAADVAPNAGGVLRDPAAFFRRGRSGAGIETLGFAALERYAARTSALAPPDLLAWLHR